MSCGHGVVQVFEGRRVFENLTIEENLVVGGHTAAQHASRSPADRTGLTTCFRFCANGDGSRTGYLVRRRAADAGDRPGSAVRTEGDRDLLDEPSLGHQRHWWWRPSSGSSAGWCRNVPRPCCWWNRTRHSRTRSPITAMSLENGRIVMEGSAATLREVEIREFLSWVERGRHPSVIPRCTIASETAANHCLKVPSLDASQRGPRRSEQDARIPLILSQGSGAALTTPPRKNPISGRSHHDKAEVSLLFLVPALDKYARDDFSFAGTKRSRMSLSLQGDRAMQRKRVTRGRTTK